jgi:hypothetical protein
MTSDFDAVTRRLGRHRGCTTPVTLLRSTCALLGFSILVTLAVAAAGCQPRSETTREKASIDTAGYALIHASAPGNNHHWNVDLSLRAAPSGTYALVFSTTEPATRGWFAIAESDPALRCAAARGRGCTIPDRGDVVSIAQVGPGGTGVLRAAFDVGTGGWFSVVRLEGGAPASASVDVRIVSEALSKDEEAYRFAIEQLAVPRS